MYEPERSKRLTVIVGAMALLHPAKGRAGDTLDLVIETRVAAAWHIYAVDAPAGNTIPTAVVEKLLEGIETAREEVASLYLL